MEGNETIDIDDYELISNNRNVKHKNAPNVHGDVGMLIKKDLYWKYNIFSIDNNIEGILDVQFVNKATEYNLVLFACYIAPHDPQCGKDGNLKMRQIVQQHALRFYLGVHPKTPLLVLEGDTGSIHPNVRRHTEMLRFWNRVLNMENLDLIK